MSDLWGWAEPPVEANLNVLGWQIFGPVGGSDPVRAIFGFVDESVPAIVSTVSVPISNRTTGSRTGGWNADKTKFAVIRTQGVNQTIRDFLTYVDCSNPNSGLWVLAPDVREVTSEGGDIAQQMKFVPPDGASIGRIRSNNSGRRVLDIVNIATGALTQIQYSTLYPAGVGNLRRWAYSLDGQWAAYTVERDSGTGDTGLIIRRRSDNVLMYSDSVALQDDISYALHHWLEDSRTFVYLSGSNVKKVSVATWTATSHSFPSEPRPRWVSPAGLFYTGNNSAATQARVWDANFNVIYSVGTEIQMDWNLEGDRMWGAQDARRYTITTPGAVATDVGFLSNEGAYRMRPWV